MKDKIKRFLLNLGFIDEEMLKESTYYLAESKGRAEEAVRTLESFDYENLYREQVEINHRLKKLEQYLEVEYVVEHTSPPLVGDSEPSFVGYRKKK